MLSVSQEIPEVSRIRVRVHSRWSRGSGETSLELGAESIRTGPGLVTAVSQQRGQCVLYASWMGYSLGCPSALTLGWGGELEGPLPPGNSAMAEPR